MLVNERETLQSEIDASQIHLEHRRRELLELKTFLPARRGGRLQFELRSVSNSQPRLTATDPVEEFLSSWIEQLKGRLGEVLKRIDSVTPCDAWPRQDVEESMFQLLRAAG